MFSRDLLDIDAAAVAAERPLLRREGAPEWVGDLLGERAVREAGVFDPRVVERLARKCRESDGAQLSNTDNMAVGGVLSTQLLHAHLVRAAPAAAAPPSFRTVVDRLEESA